MISKNGLIFREVAFMWTLGRRKGRKIVMYGKIWYLKLQALVQYSYDYERNVQYMLL